MTMTMNMIMVMTIFMTNDHDYCSSIISTSSSSSNSSTRFTTPFTRAFTVFPLMVVFITYVTMQTRYLLNSIIPMFQSALSGDYRRLFFLNKSQELVDMGLFDFRILPEKVNKTLFNFSCLLFFRDFIKKKIQEKTLRSERGYV